MEETRSNNSCMLRGVLASGPVYSHEARGEEFYKFELEIQRLSGTTDTVCVIARKALLDEVEITGDAMLCVAGSIRSFNNKTGVGQKLVISVFAQEIWLDDEDDENSVCLTGTICKQPSLRVTPMGREICDIMLAVNRHYGRSDYLPCIAWGQKAKDISKYPIGTVISLEGRLQSRKYTKTINDEPVEKTAYEVSIIAVTKEDT